MAQVEFTQDQIAEFAVASREHLERGFSFDNYTTYKALRMIEQLQVREKMLTEALKYGLKARILVGSARAKASDKFYAIGTAAIARATGDTQR